MANSVILINSSSGGSIVNFRGSLITELRKRGYQIVATAPNIDAGTAKAIRKVGAEPVDLPLDRTGTNVLADLRYAMRLYRLIRALKPDLVLGYTIKPNIWGGIAARLAGVPSSAMITGLGYAFLAGDGWRRRTMQIAAKTLYKIALGRSRCVIFQNPDDQADFVAAGCLQDSNKARMVNGSGVDILHYSPAPLPPHPVFLLIARLLVTKGVREFVSAAAIVQKKLPEAKFVIVGPLDTGPDGISIDECLQWPASLVDYIGELSDVRPAIASSNIFVLPSYREGTPRSVLEAMAMGRPIITTDAPGCRQTVVDGDSGFLVPVGEVSSLATAMLRLGSNPELRVSMGEASLARARKVYAGDAVNDALLNHLQLPPINK